MAAVVQLPFTLPKAEGSAKAGAHGSLSAPTTDKATLLPAGPSYIAHTRRQLKQLSFDDDDAAEEERLAALQSQTGAEGDDVDIPDEPESKEVLSRDPADWKVRKSGR